MKRLTVSAAEATVVVGDCDQVEDGVWVLWLDDKPTHIKTAITTNHTAVRQLQVQRYYRQTQVRDCSNLKISLLLILSTISFKCDQNNVRPWLWDTQTIRCVSCNRFLGQARPKTQQCSAIDICSDVLMWHNLNAALLSHAYGVSTDVYISCFNSHLLDICYNIVLLVLVPVLYMPVVATIYTVSQKMTQLWNGIARNYMDDFGVL